MRYLDRRRYYLPAPVSEEQLQIIHERSTTHILLGDLIQSPLLKALDHLLCDHEQFCDEGIKWAARLRRELSMGPRLQASLLEVVPKTLNAGSSHWHGSSGCLLRRIALAGTVLRMSWPPYQPGAGLRS
jgi:hypothetical protein